MTDTGSLRAAGAQRHAPPTIGERFTAAAVFGAVMVLFAFYGAYLVRALVELPSELAALAFADSGWRRTETAYSLVLAVWALVAGKGLVAARVFSLVAAIASLVLVFRIGRRLTHDGVTAAFLTLSFVLFPPLVGTLICATPHALSGLLALAALDLILSTGGQSVRRALLYGGLAGLCAAFVLMLVPLGGVLMPLWLLFCAGLTGQRHAVAAALVVCTVSAGLILLSGIAVPSVDLDLTAAGQGTVFKALVLPYAMVPVTVVLGAIALFSAQVRAELGLMRGLVVLGAPLAAAVLLLAAVAANALTMGQLLTAVGYVIPFAIFAPWPLIAWIRRVMPGVTSLGAWIVFPVIMYSCFWVILGPINPDRFPYSHRTLMAPPYP